MTSITCCDKLVYYACTFEFNYESDENIVLLAVIIGLIPFLWNIFYYTSAVYGQHECDFSNFSLGGLTPPGDRKEIKLYSPSHRGSFFQVQIVMFRFKAWLAEHGGKSTLRENPTEAQRGGGHGGWCFTRVLYKTTHIKKKTPRVAGFL